MKCKKICLSLLVAVLTAFICIFGFSYNNNNIASVSADSSSANYEFNGSGFFFRATEYAYDLGGPSAVSGQFENVDCYFSIDSLTSTNYSLSVKLPIPNYNFFVTYSSSASILFDDWYYSFLTHSEGLQNYKFIVHYNVDSGFNANVRYFHLETNRWAGVNADIAQHQFYLYDSNGKCARFFLFANFDAYDSVVDGLITYSAFAYLPRDYFLTSDISDNDYYQTGYSNGFNAGKSEGLTEGQSVGYSNGFNAGKDVGFNEGVLSANDYSFLGLIGAVVDAPLNMFVQTFDFEILGFNMKDFFLSILTIALIFTIIRLCMGGKS